ncbi:MAG TPA: GntR family transcriptional regulator [Hyphomonadaceae bacterium]|nr:GntR family transcriptional regulator [Hyphomonadaceae bacterium]
MNYPSQRPPAPTIPASELGPLGRSGPLYVRLEQLLRSAVDEDRLQAGAALPSERDLCDAYGVSRVTVRKALDELARDGLLVRRRGSGTYVVDAPLRNERVEKNFSTLSSFSEDMISRGRTPGSRWLVRGAGKVSPQEALALSLSPGSSVYRFRRLRLADDAPMALELSIIAGFALPSVNAVGASLYDALSQGGFRPVRALQRLRAETAGAERAGLLEVDTEHAGLMIERRAFLADGRPVELTHSFYRGDAYDMVAELGS